MTIPPRATTAQGIAAHLVGAGVPASVLGDGAAPVTRLEVFDRAGPGCLTFIRIAKFAKRWAEARGAVALISADVAPLAWPEGVDGSRKAAGQPGRALIVIHDADLALVEMLSFFAPPAPVVAPGVHATAVVDPSARVSASASVGPHCVLSAGASIGERTRLVAGVFVGVDASVGADTLLHPNVCVLDRCVIGNHCILHAGVTIGADGFGFRPAPNGKGLIKVPHIGNAVIEDGVEIGANSCVDRGKFASTVIGAGTKIDNLVQIAHNVTVGRSCVICGGCMLAGSTTLGDGVVLAGGVGVSDGVTVGAGARIGALSGVNHDVPAGGDYMGFPVGPASEWRRTFAKMRKMGRRTEGVGEAG